MGIDRESDIAATLRIGPTERGMVRVYVEAEGLELPMDFDPEEALEIAEELAAAAEIAKGSGTRGGKPGARAKRKGQGSAEGGRS